MTAPQWDPSAEQIEALAKELCEAFNTGDSGGQTWRRLTNNGHDGYRAEARFVLRRQHEREHRLLDTLAVCARYGGEPGQLARETLTAHAKLDAPPPTLLEAAKALLSVIVVGQECVPPVTAARTTIWLPDPRIEALKAAVEREDAK